MPGSCMPALMPAVDSRGQPKEAVALKTIHSYASMCRMRLRCMLAGTQVASNYLGIILRLRQVLLRALRDFNMGKLTADDTGIFMGLLNDLFHGTVEHVPRAMNPVSEEKVLCLRMLSNDMGIVPYRYTKVDIKISCLVPRSLCRCRRLCRGREYSAGAQSCVRAGVPANRHLLP